MLNRLEVDQAVFFSVLTRGWQFLAGPVTMLFIAARFTGSEQGYFYTFASLVGLQTLIELGLHGVIVSVASHEWALLSLDGEGNVRGPDHARARLAALRDAMLKWYGTIGLLFVLGGGTFGLWFFGRQPDSGVEWRSPWLTLVALHGILIVLLPLTSMLEGCRQVVPVNRVRFAQAASGHAVVWLSVLSGLGLWTAVVSSAVRLVWDLWLVRGMYGRFFGSLRGLDVSGVLDWWQEVWPLQWRTAVRAVIGFLSMGLIVPVVFNYHGDAEAGRLGMTWTAIVALEAAALAWVQTRIPLFGTLIAQKDFRELDRVFFRLTKITCIVFAIGAAALCAVVVLLPMVPHHFAHKLADRLLPIAPTALFCLATLLLLPPRCMMAYVLAHKRDPFIQLSLLPGLFCIPVVFLAGRAHGALGEAAGYLAIVALLSLPISTWIWNHSRREWH